MANHTFAGVSFGTPSYAHIIIITMKATNALNSDEAKEAQRQAVRGAGIGAVKWGFASAVLGGIAYAMSPVYKGLTVQFKV